MAGVNKGGQRPSGTSSVPLGQQQWGLWPGWVPSAEVIWTRVLACLWPPGTPHPTPVCPLSTWPGGWNEGPHRHQHEGLTAGCWPSVAHRGGTAVT